ncbi:hypothetical protein [Chitinimonas lacunae]|uniref:Zinc ribbon domain-containing protein n=1 Tax=Chitinimonas lacunae TaxID=1963018 RepID=A0ABV8MT51_9NEIS
MLIKCKECGGHISKKAVVCPKCGAKQSQLNMMMLAVVLAGIAVAVAAGKTVVAGDDPVEKPTPPQTAAPAVPAAPAAQDAPIASENKEIKDFVQATKDAGVKSTDSH